MRVIEILVCSDDVQDHERALKGSVDMNLDGRMLCGNWKGSGLYIKNMFDSHVCNKLKKLIMYNSLSQLLLFQVCVVYKIFIP